MEKQDSNRDKKTQYNIALVAIMALLLMAAGDLLGMVVTVLVTRFFPGMSDGMYYALSNYLPFIGIFLAVPIYLYITDRELFSEVLRSPKGLRGNTYKLFFLGSFLGFLTNGICILVAWLHGDVHFVSGYVDWAAMLVAFIVVFIQSSAEEFLTRHYVLGAIKRNYPVWVAIVFNAVFFMALHLANDGINLIAIISLTVTGLSYSIAVHYLDSIWIALGLHTAWNYTQNFIFGLPNSGLVSESSILKLDAASNSAVYDVEFGVEGTFVSILVDALLGVGIYLCVRNRRRAEIPAEEPGNFVTEDKKDE